MQEAAKAALRSPESFASGGGIVGAAVALAASSDEVAVQITCIVVGGLVALGLAAIRVFGRKDRP